MQHRTLLEYKRYRYLRVALLLAGLAIIATLTHRPAVGAYGGTWLGYMLGTISALIVVLLLWLGVRRRQYMGVGTMQGWLSAHVYLGTALILLATLHTGFQFGWNVHTLAYGLMMAVIFSGFYGLYAYLRFPRMLTENMGEDNLESILLKIADLDELARVAALPLPDEINRIVRRVSQETRIGGSVLQQLSGRQKDCPNSMAVKKLHALGRNMKSEQSRHLRELYSMMLRRESLVARARLAIMLKGRLEIWQYFHVPFSIALIAALCAHIFSIFFYW